MDCGFDQATWPVATVKLFAFVSEVGPRRGGTMVLPGTHRPVDRYQDNWRAFMRHHPWPSRLLHGVDLPDHGRSLVGETAELDDVPVQVVELTGSPGDVVITHLHVFHARTRCTGTAARLMLGKEIHCRA